MTKDFDFEEYRKLFQLVFYRYPKPDDFENQLPKISMERLLLIFRTTEPRLVSKVAEAHLKQTVSKEVMVKLRKVADKYEAKDYHEKVGIGEYK